MHEKVKLEARQTLLGTDRRGRRSPLLKLTLIFRVQRCRSPSFQVHFEAVGCNSELLLSVLQ